MGRDVFWIRMGRAKTDEEDVESDKHHYAGQYYSNDLRSQLKEEVFSWMFTYDAGRHLLTAIIAI